MGTSLHIILHLLTKEEYVVNDETSNGISEYIYTCPGKQKLDTFSQSEQEKTLYFCRFGMNTSSELRTIFIPVFINNNFSYFQVS